MASGPEPIRRLPVRGTWAYLDPLGVAPGESVAVHVSAEAAHRIELVRLGRQAVLDPAQSLDDDRREAEVLDAVDCPVAAAQTITPGSYIHVGGAPLPAGPLTLGLWLRLWRLPPIDVVQVGWHGLIGDLDYPDAARFGLVVDHVGRIGVYLGDGGPFRHAWLHMGPPLMRARLGRWLHVLATWSDQALRLHVDGEVMLDEAVAVPRAASGPASRLRIGAMAEGGEADGFLDGDIAGPFVVAGTADPATVTALVADRGRRSPTELGVRDVLGWWPLDEERGTAVRDASGYGRHGTIVNHATWMVGGPTFDPADRMPLAYDPDADPDHGHGLRLSSDDLMDAGWPVAARFAIPADADSGFYAVRVQLQGQDEADACVAPLVVVRRKPRRPGSIALLAATNTWHAYGRRATKELLQDGLASGLYSVHGNGRPFFHMGLRLPIPMAQPYAFESRRALRTRSTHLVRSERFLEAWLAAEGYPYEVVTDLDLHQEPELLREFAALALVGHSEYWSDAARDGVLRYLEGGGRVVSLSGDTLSVRVTFDAGLTEMECRKIVFDDDPRHLNPPFWGESWHSHDRKPGGSFRRLGKPSWDVLGMSFKGMIDDGTVTSFGSYTALATDHFLFHTPHEVPLVDGRLGLRSLNGSGGASGYEFDANLDRTGMGPAPLPGVTTLASVVDQRNIEWLGQPNHGADLIYWERPGGGIVVNFGSIGSAGALPVDPGIAALLRNTLAHFGIASAGVAAP